MNPYFASTVNGNALHIPLPSGSVQCVITSPPYYGLRDFGTAHWVGGDLDCDHVESEIRTGQGLAKYSEQHRGGGHKQGKVTPILYKSICGKCGSKREDQQIGIEGSPQQYIDNMVDVFREVHRVLRPNGTVWLNMGDTYANDRPRGSYGDQGDLSTGVHGEKIPVRDWSCWNLKKKDLAGIPWRLALALQADGWWLRSDVIWHKPNPLPGSVIDRPTSAHEYVFLLTKSEKYFYDHYAVREKGADTKHTRQRYKYKPSKAKKKAQNKDSNIENLDFAHYFISDGYRNKRTVWTIAPESYSEAHFATFPQKLVEPMILAGTSEAGCCPECGNPWKRILKKIVLPPPDRQNNNAFKTSPDGRHGTGTTTLRDTVKYETLGFEPTCWHGTRHPIPQAELDADPSLLDDYETKPHKPIGCLVLDPFSGTSVVGRVAVKHRQRFLGVELNPEYIKLAVKRTNNVQVTLPFDISLGGKDGN